MGWRTSIGIALIALSQLAFADASSVLAQAGSVGGTIGNQDKTISGGAETDRPRAPLHSTRPVARAPNESTSLPSTIHLHERTATYGDYSATLKRTNSNTYDAVWNRGGTTSRMTVTIGRESIAIERSDTSGVFPCHGHYTGARVPGTSKASGEDSGACGVVGFTDTWDASW
jgi:hypothetical protein